MERLDLRASSPEKTAAPHAEIDLARLRQLGMVTPDAGAIAVAEEFRVIKRPLLDRAVQGRAAGARKANLVLVTSALPGEGKTYCAVNLAMSIAMEKDHTVLLVDADATHPCVLHLLGIAPASGLIDVLLAEAVTMPAALSRVIMRTNIATLGILPAGRGHQQASELLASSAMHALLDDIATRYPDRIVIVDAPAVLSGSEASALAAHMGQVVLVVESDATSQRDVRAALQRLGPGTRIDLVCNKARAASGTPGH